MRTFLRLRAKLLALALAPRVVLSALTATATILAIASVAFGRPGGGQTFSGGSRSSGGGYGGGGYGGGGGARAVAALSFQ